MSTVDDAVEAGARAHWMLLNGCDPEWAEAAWDDMGGSEPTDERSGYELAALTVTRTAWPILSAGLRKLHGEGLPRGRYPGDSERHTFCTHCRGHWPCATVQELDRIDKELGL